MSRQYADLQLVLQQLVEEHRKLLKHVETQQLAMKAMDLNAMDAAAKLQEAARLRIASMENRRRTVVGQLAQVMRLGEGVTIQKLAELNPQYGPNLLKLREELKGIIQQVAARTHVSQKLAGAVLGHLNTVVRLLAGAVEQAGLYTKHGVPQVSSRIGVMEAVG